MKETAESMGIDTENYVATEEDKQFIKDYNFEHKATQLESGKVKTYLISRRNQKVISISENGYQDRRNQRNLMEKGGK